MAALIVLVGGVPRWLRIIDVTLSDAGHLVAAVSSSAEAQQLLDSVTPDLLVVDAREHAAPLLRLAARSRRDHPILPVIVTHDGPEPDGDARRRGAEFVSAAVGRAGLLARVAEAIERHRRAQPGVRRWARRRVPAAVVVNAGDTRARVIDISHGGVQLAFDDARDPPDHFDITLPKAGATIAAHRAWTARGTRDGVSCGAEIDETARPAWRHFVESIACSDATRS